MSLLIFVLSDSEWDWCACEDVIDLRFDLGNTQFQDEFEHAKLVENDSDS